MTIVRQSDLSSFSRCAQQKKLNDIFKASGTPREQLSRTAFGSVMHHAVSVMERLHFEKRLDALEKAHVTFAYYWTPENITQICEAVTIWCARDTYTGMLKKGHETLDLYRNYQLKDTSKLLALEIEFNLPFELDGVQHTFHGTMDRLSLRKLSGQSFLNIEDFKTGKDYEHLRWNAQFSGYSWATTQEKFWTDAWGEDEGLDLYDQLRLLARRGTWISLKSGVVRKDAGWRGPQDYDRFWACVRGYVKAVELDVYPLSLTGAVCFFCPYREGICGGVAVPDEDYGRPAPKQVTS